VWSVGLTVIEVALGHYPYPPETYANVFAQLTAIVHGDPPELPDQFSDVAKDFTSRCLQKIPQNRASYSGLLVSDRLPSNPVRETNRTLGTPVACRRCS
jgi:mitogen-activated protein kinase kinase